MIKVFQLMQWKINDAYLLKEKKNFCDTLT